MDRGRGDETPDVPEPHQGVVLPGEAERWGDQVPPTAAQPRSPAPPQGAYGQHGTGSPPEPGFYGSYAPQQAYGPPGPEYYYGQPGPLPDPAWPGPFEPPAYGAPQYPTPGVPGPAGAEATQLLPPYPQAMPPASAPPASASGDAESTQLLRPVPGALLPEAVPLEAAPPMPPVAPFGILPGLPGDQPQPQPPYEDATQQLPRFEEQLPEPHRTAPPSDYDHLYRQDSQPRRQAPAQASPPQYQRAAPHQQQYQPPYAEPEAPRRRLSPAALVGIVVGGCAVVGLAAGALMSGDGENSGVPVASTSTAPRASASTSASASAGTSEAESQAKALDALLADSGSSRSSVIAAVQSVKTCQNLDQAASDLRAAAEQRNSLVTKLGQLSVDALPDHQALTDALNKAWKASAAADIHYAAWADQARSGKNVCKGGTARTTGQTQAGNRESGTASAAKDEAVKLWNVIAGKYDLTERAKTQL